MTTSPRPPGDQAITIPDPDWRQLATCQHAKPEPFFPVYHSLRLGRIRGSGRQGGPSAERAFTAALKARPMISIAGQLDGSARGYQEPFALCGSHGYPVGGPYVYAPARFGRTSGSAAWRASGRSTVQDHSRGRPGIMRKSV